MKTINIGTVRVPLTDYAVSCNAILGIRDSGKTVTAKGIAEQLLEAKVPIFVFDAVGKWRWMKTPGPGKHGHGYSIVVVGGRAPDLPLNPHSVGEIVRSAIREKVPVVIDLYDPKLSKADWRRIVQQSIRIIHYEANGLSHVFLEEAAEFIPQKVQDGETYAEVEKLARMGGNASVGITLINQRSQEVNKAVLDLSHNLILGCQIGNKAIEAVEKWVDRLAPEIAEKVTTSLPKLKSGEAWVWTRSNPDQPALEQMPMCRSLHPDRRTPDTVIESSKPVNTDEFVTRLGASIPKVIEEAKANDPAALKQQIAKLQRELAAKPSAAPEIREVPVVDEATKDLLARIHNRIGAVQVVQQEARDAFNALCDEVKKVEATLRARLPQPAPFIPSRPQTLERMAAKARRTESNGEPLPQGERKILTACAQFGDVPKDDFAVLTGFKRSTRDAYIQRLREKGYVRDNGGAVMATTEGLDALGGYDELPVGCALQSYWRNRLPDGERVIFDLLVKSYPEWVDREEIDEATGYKRSTRDAYLQRMKPKRIIDVDRGMVRASEKLFD